MRALSISNIEERKYSYIPFSKPFSEAFGNREKGGNWIVYGKAGQGKTRFILQLAKDGFQKQILVSGDTARKSYYYSYTYALGLPYIIKGWVPRLIEEADAAGLDGEQLVEDIFINNPRECFTFKGTK